MTSGDGEKVSCYLELHELAVQQRARLNAGINVRAGVVARLGGGRGEPNRYSRLSER